MHTQLSPNIIGIKDLQESLDIDTVLWIKASAGPIDRNTQGHTIQGQV